LCRTARGGQTFFFKCHIQKLILKNGSISEEQAKKMRILLLRMPRLMERNSGG